MGSFRKLMSVSLLSVACGNPSLAGTVCNVTINDHLLGGSYEMKLGPSLLQSDKIIRNFDHVFDYDAQIFKDHDDIMLSSEKARLQVKFVDFGMDQEVWQQTDNLTLILPETRAEFGKQAGCDFANFPHIKFSGTMISTGGDNTVTKADLNLVIISTSENEDTVKYAVGTLKASIDLPADGRILRIRHTYYVELIASDS